jgi:hypothetical protein
MTVELLNESPASGRFFRQHSVEKGRPVEQADRAADDLELPVGHQVFLQVGRPRFLLGLLLFPLLLLVVPGHEEGDEERGLPHEHRRRGRGLVIDGHRR